jgi:Zn-finger nucleic acid-binding protein
MQCPVDGTALVMTERSGVEIDYCPKCRGVWLDRGELDKIVDRAAPAAPPVALEEPRRAPAPPPQRPAETYRPAEPPRHRDDDDDYRYGKKRRKGGFLDDLFDF